MRKYGLYSAVCPLSHRVRMSKQCANILFAIRKMHKNDIGKSNTALANMWITFKYLLILILTSFHSDMRTDSV